MLGVSVDTPFAARAFADQLGLTFPLLGEWPNNEVARRYGVYLQERHFAERKTFIIDRDGVVRAILADRTPQFHATDALEEVKKLQAEAG